MTSTSTSRAAVVTVAARARAGVRVPPPRPSNNNNSSLRRHAIMNGSSSSSGGSNNDEHSNTTAAAASSSSFHNNSTTLHHHHHLNQPSIRPTLPSSQRQAPHLATRSSRIKTSTTLLILLLGLFLAFCTLIQYVVMGPTNSFDLPPDLNSKSKINLTLFILCTLIVRISFGRDEVVKQSSSSTIVYIAFKHSEKIPSSIT